MPPSEDGSEVSWLNETFYIQAPKQLSAFTQLRLLLYSIEVAKPSYTPEPVSHDLHCCVHARVRARVRVRRGGVPDASIHRRTTKPTKPILLSTHEPFNHDYICDGTHDAWMCACERIDHE